MVMWWSALRPAWSRIEKAFTRGLLRPIDFLLAVLDWHVDGFHAAAEDLVARAAPYLRVEDLDAFVNTHEHFDHTFGTGTHVLFRRKTHTVRANWKLIFENYSECYHCPGVHPALQKLTPYDLAENDLCDGPFLGGYMPITKGHSLTMSGNACALAVGDIRQVQ